jgi:hypothetical protein
MLTKPGYHSLDGGTARTLTRLRFRGWPIAIITSLTVIVLQRGSPALSRALITQGEASITAHGGSATLQECMALWDAGTHMSKVEWNAACKRTMVLDAVTGSSTNR